MPVYLVHGFRWPRQSIRVHIITNNLDDAAPEWLVAPGTTRALLEHFHTKIPSTLTHLPCLRFVEQYDPIDTKAFSQPYAYVADVCHEVSLGIDIDEVQEKGLPSDQSTALVTLRDWIFNQPFCGVGDANPKVGWYVVVCGDEERRYADDDDDGEEDRHSEILANGVEAPVPTACVTCGRTCACAPDRHVAETDTADARPWTVASAAPTASPALNMSSPPATAHGARRPVLKEQTSLASITQSIRNAFIRRRVRSDGNAVTSPINGRILSEKNKMLGSNTSKSRSTNSSDTAANRFDAVQTPRSPQVIR